MLISLLILPGSGQQDVTLNEGTTIRQLVQAKSLHGRQIILNVSTILESGYDRVLRSGDEVAATASVKGA